MSHDATHPALSSIDAPKPASLMNAGIYVQLGLLLGVLMPVVSAIAYPTYTHEMRPSWLEFTRLSELPFVLCEVLIVQVALRRGYDDLAAWRAVPRDVRIALAVLFAGLTVGSVLSSKHVPVSVMLSLVVLIHLRFGAAIFFLARRDSARSVKPLVPLLAGGLAILVLLIALRFAFPPSTQLLSGAEIEWGSAMPGFISVRHLGSWSGALAAGLLLSMLFDRSGIRHSTALLYFLAVGVTAWSGTRAAVLAMAVVALVGVATTRRLPSPRSLALMALLSVAALVLAMLLAPNDPAFTLFASNDMQNASTMTSGRTELWAATYSAWLRAPIFGWGSGSTFWEVQVGWTHTQPHNFILQALISWGIVGAAGALWLLIRAITAVHARGFGDPALRPLAGTLYALLFMSLLEGMLHYPRFIMMIMIGFAVILARSAESDAGGAEAEHA